MSAIDRRRTPDVDGTIYVLECCGLLKIGFTQRPLDERLDDIRKGNPFPIRILAARAGNMRREQTMHRLLWLHRHVREWYHDSPYLRATLSRMGMTLANPEPTAREIEFAADVEGRRQAVAALAEYVRRRGFRIMYWLGRAEGYRRGYAARDKHAKARTKAIKTQQERRAAGFYEGRDLARAQLEARSAVATPAEPRDPDPSETAP